MLEPGQVQDISTLPFSFLLDVFLGDFLCLLGWNVEVFLLCPLNCVVDFWCSPYVVPESICFLFVWEFEILRNKVCRLKSMCNLSVTCLALLDNGAVV